MKVNSRILAIMSLFFVCAILISSVSATDYNLTDRDFNKSFEMGVPDGIKFQEGAYTNIDVGDVNFTMKVFDNVGVNPESVISVLYFKDSSPDSNIISDVIDDLKK